jgi:hypothetical protein
LTKKKGWDLMGFIVIYWDFIVIYSDLMGFNGIFLVIYSDLMGYHSDHQKNG